MGTACSPFRVKNPVQNPTTHPRTIENCSRASIEPRVSGELISAMYKGETILCHRSARRTVKRFGRYVESTGETIPKRTDAEATDGPSNRDLRQRTCPCLQGGTYAEDSFKRTKPNQQRHSRHKVVTGISQGPYAPQADAIDDRLETLSASTPAPSAPNRHPSSSTAAI
jgi:hypothetical protein